jgi:hypothetical protein
MEIQLSYHAKTQMGKHSSHDTWGTTGDGLSFYRTTGATGDRAELPWYYGNGEA